MLTTFVTCLLSGFGLGFGTTAGAVLGGYTGVKATAFIEDVLPDDYTFGAQGRRYLETLTGIQATSQRLSERIRSGCEATN